MMVSGVSDDEEVQMATDEELEFNTVIEGIEQFPRQVKWALEHAPEDRIVDVLGTINHVATAINVEKRRAASEMQTGDHGKTWKVEQSRRGMRSYNTSGIIGSIGEQFGHDSRWETIRMLLFDKVITIEWSWTNLEKLMKLHNLDLRVARHEIEDDDPDFDYGEFWIDAPIRYVPNERKKETT
jgi:hypothetical protein